MLTKCKISKTPRTIMSQTIFFHTLSCVDGREGRGGGEGGKGREGRGGGYPNGFVARVYKTLDPHYAFDNNNKENN